MIRVTIYNENIHEETYEGIRKIYPEGIHGCIKNFLSQDSNLKITTATFNQAEHGLSEEVLKNTDVLVYWSHAKQNEFSDSVALRIQKHVLMGMGFIPLHSAHFSKPVKLLLGTSMTLRWKHGQKELLWATCPSHPIAQGITFPIELPKEEMYGEYFDIPKADDVIFTGWFSTGDVFRSGVTFSRGKGRIFYFQPGHEEYPIYYNKAIQKIIKNAVYWTYNPDRSYQEPSCTQVF